MKHKKYSSLLNFSNKKIKEQLSEIGNHIKDSCEWIVFEKVHGANFAIAFDGDIVKFWSRNRDVTNDNFFNYATIKDDLTTAVKSLFENHATHHIIIYGELFGGFYPNIKSKYKKVQDGVYYSPNIEFNVFDIFIDKKWSTAENMIQMVQSVELSHVPILFKGSYDDCLSFPNDNETLIPKILGYDEPYSMMEGTVIKPYNKVLRVGGDESGRFIIKNKNKKFSERKQRIKKVRNETILPDNIKELLDSYATYLTKNRLNCVISKIGEITPKHFTMLVGLMNKDILEEMEIDHDIQLPKSELKLYHKACHNECKNWLSGDIFLSVLS